MQKKKPLAVAGKKKTRTGLQRDDNTQGNMVAQRANRKRQQKQMHKQTGK